MNPRRGHVQERMISENVFMSVLVALSRPVRDLEARVKQLDRNDDHGKR
ncbi:MAG TPA: hypothetical protein VKM55_15600 [Candidatus Lokiarchaeia archaeon]|nr:hypothetical protein [Candidatus Lokiarchaeia archaeon]